MSNEFAGLSQIGQIAINVQDVERATAFYRDVLGLRFLFAYPGLAFFDAGGVRLMLSRAEDPKLDHPASILYYRVPVIEAAHEALVSRGVHFERSPHLVARMPDHELWLAELQDSEGNILALMTEKR
jgi:methylmalonyl-CoA/ethylmalonyl-CoA epimerase